MQPLQGRVRRLGALLPLLLRLPLLRLLLLGGLLWHGAISSRWRLMASERGL